MTMGPAIFAWINEAGGLMRFVSGDGIALWRRGSRSSGASLRGDFDLDLHRGLVEPGNDEESGSRPDIAELFAADREYGIGVAGVGDVIDRADDVGHREAGIRQHVFDGLEAVSRLARDIRRQLHGGVIVTGGAGNEDEIAIDDGAAVAGSFFERRTGGNQAARHGGPLA